MKASDKTTEDWAKGVQAALGRAAEVARQRAIQHGTDLVLKVDGKMEFVDPKTMKVKKKTA
jgi:hypothetical protein